VQPAPIPLSLAGGALVGSSTVENVPGIRAILIDTGSPLTIYDDGTGVSRGHAGLLRLYSSELPAVPRLELSDVQLFVSPLRSLGLAPAAEIGAVLGGDNLSRFAVELDYQTPPRISLPPVLTTCSCALADACQAVFPFKLLGGNQTFALGGDLFNYPPTRVILDACLEPLPDPVSNDVKCATNSREDGLLSNAYAPTGVDLKLLVATGFPGLLLSASAYDRLRGAGAAQAALAAAPLLLRLPDVRDDDADGNGIDDPTDGLMVAEVELGTDGHSALALVSRERYFGPCAELSRSRRQRRVPPGAVIPQPNPTLPQPQPELPPQSYENACLQDPPTSKVAAVQSCQGGSECNDNDAAAAPTAAVIELTAPLRAYITRDTAPILVAINADVRRGPGIQGGAPTVDGLMGTGVLDHLHSTIDYPGGRFVARCAAPGCLTYRRFSVESQCGLDCIPAKCTFGPRDPDACRCTAEPGKNTCAPMPLPGGRCDP